MREDCLICGEKIHRGNSQASLKSVRGKNDVTCSKKCAKVFRRTQDYFVNRLKNLYERKLQEKLDKEIKKIKKEMGKEQIK